MEQKIDAILEIVNAFEREARTNAKGNKAAGVRARKHALTIIGLLKEYRKESIPE